MKIKHALHEKKKTWSFKWIQGNLGLVSSVIIFSLMSFQTNFHLWVNYTLILQACMKTMYLKQNMFFLHFLFMPLKDFSF